MVGTIYQVDDTVLYGTNGVCRVAEIVPKNFGGKITEYYVLRPIRNSHNTIYVPVQNQALASKMRRVLSPEEIYALIQAMPEVNALWYEDENERKEKFREIITRGDRQELIRVMKALYLHQREQQARGKKLHLADERFFKEAEKMLYEEFAIVLNMEPEQVVPLILEQIQMTEKASS